MSWRDGKPRRAALHAPRQQRTAGPEALTLTALRGPLALAVLCAVPLVLWARAAAADVHFSGPSTSLTSLAVLCALAGTASFALNIVLGARLRIVEWLFGGLDRMYKAHRVNGQIAFVLLLSHVALILASRATVSAGTALDLLGPQAGRTVFAGVLAFSAMTVCMVLTLFVRLGHEVFVYVQRTLGVVFLVAAYHVFTTPGAKAGSPALEAYLATLATLGVAAFAYRSLLGNVLVRRHRYRVQAVNRLDEFVTEIVMDPLEQPLDFVPGQFAFVNFRSIALSEQFRPFELFPEGRAALFSFHAGEISNQFHPFSITSAPGERRLRMTVKAVGDYTRALRTLEVGADAVVEGPYGSFSHRNVPERGQVWLAGGIGVTPFLSMARSLGNRGGPAVDFYYCVEHEAEAHFSDELRAVGERREDFRVFLVPRDEAGLITAERIEEQSGDLASRAFLICGPPAMIAALRSQLLAKGVPAERIHAEEFGFARLGRRRSELRGTPPRRRYAEALAALGVLALGALVLAGIVVAQDPGSPAAREPAGARAGKTVFASAGCGSCHTLEAAGSRSSAGPNLDETDPGAALVREVVANGSGAMPSFRDRLTEREIRDVAAFVASSAKE